MRKRLIAVAQASSQSPVRPRKIRARTIWTFLQLARSGPEVRPTAYATIESVLLERSLTSSLMNTPCESNTPCRNHGSG